jgi:hypothetical protein
VGIGSGLKNRGVYGNECGVSRRNGSSPAGA